MSKNICESFQQQAETIRKRLSIEVCLNVKPISVNQCDVSLFGGRRVKSHAYHKFKKEADIELSKVVGLKELGKCFDRKKHSISMDYIFTMPEKLLMTKDEMISKRSGDIDNLIKPINDLIFKELSIENKTIDDSAVLDLKAKKVCGEEFSIYFLIRFEKLI